MNPLLSRRLAGFANPTVWHEFTPLAVRYEAINLGQGAPDWQPEDFCIQAAQEALAMTENQYARSGGHPLLCQTLAEHYSPLFGRDLDWQKELTVSVGATEGIYASLQSLINPGDEVVLMEPCFDIYRAQVQMAGGVCQFVPLHPPSEDCSHWHLNEDELRACFNENTKVLVLNNPHNPTGHVFRREELAMIASVVESFPQVTVITDEVYEHIVFDGHEHVRFGSLPNMWERTLTCSSAGKTFSITGWKIGWVIGPEHLLQGVFLTNQWIQFSVCTPLQVAVANILRQAEKPYTAPSTCEEGERGQTFDTFYDYLRHRYQRKRDLLTEALSEAGLHPILPEGGIFVMADTTPIQKHLPSDSTHLTDPGPDGSSPVTTDWALARYLTVEHGVTPIPPSAFYSPEHEHMAESLLRFAFCKKDDSLEEGARRLVAMKGKLEG